MHDNHFFLNRELNADLHNHSNVSDGVLPPEVLAVRAKENGVELWALTDHDEVSGCEKAKQAAHDLGLPFICGVEVSVSFLSETIHVVGLGVDHQQSTLISNLAHNRQGRIARAQAIAQSLEKAGIKGCYEGAMRYTQKPETISRMHFARYLVEIGACENPAAVFKRYLTEGKPGYIAHLWTSLQNSVQWIREAGGIAVLAHPGRYKRLRPKQEDLLFEQFIEFGGLGVEVVTGSHSPQDAIKYTQKAIDYNLWASRGSDFHAPGESRIDLGALPPLSTKLEPVWLHLANRIHY